MVENSDSFLHTPTSTSKGLCDREIFLFGTPSLFRRLSDVNTAVAKPFVDCLMGGDSGGSAAQSLPPWFPWAQRSMPVGVPGKGWWWMGEWVGGCSSMELVGR